MMNNSGNFQPLFNRCCPIGRNWTAHVELENHFTDNLSIVMQILWDFVLFLSKFKFKWIDHSKIYTHHKKNGEKTPKKPGGGGGFRWGHGGGGGGGGGGDSDEDMGCGMELHTEKNELSTENRSLKRVRCNVGDIVIRLCDMHMMTSSNKNDIEGRNTLGCLDQYTWRGLRLKQLGPWSGLGVSTCREWRLWNNRNREAVYVVKAVILPLNFFQIRFFYYDIV